MTSQLAQLQGEIKEYGEQLETVQSGLQADPDNIELQTLKNELEEIISLTQTQIDELQPAAPSGPSESKSSLPTKEKWSKENHPAYQAGYRKPARPASPTDDATPTSANYKVNDMVLARWISGDKAFYPARITSVTGSTAAPVYYVKFKNYNTTETLRSGDLKPVTSDSRKRRWGGHDEATPAASSPSSTSASSTSASSPTTHQPGTSGNVISAAANINPALASQAKREPSKVSDGPARPAKVPRKVKANRELEAGKNKWQDFTAKGGKMGRGAKKESMFRTGEGVNARVGFTGSGQAMRKDPTRSRHVYQSLDEDAY